MADDKGKHPAGPGPHHPAAAGEHHSPAGGDEPKKHAKKADAKENVKIDHRAVGKFSQGDVVSADVFGDDLQRLIDLGAVEYTDEPATVTADGEPIPPPPPEPPPPADEKDAHKKK
jgi:hypothetical protein